MTEVNDHVTKINIPSTNSGQSVNEIEKIAKEIVAKELTLASNKFDKDLEKMSRSVRADFMIMFGLFASVITFLSVEIKIFQISTRFSLLIGSSLFILSAVLLFALSLQNIAKRENFKSLSKNPLIWVIVIIILGSMICFYWATIIRP